MNVLDLNEAEGITEEALTSYLNRRGWCNLLSNPRVRLLKPAYVRLNLEMGLAAALERLAKIEERSVQTLLLDINPRMRPSLPSKAARDAHPGSWICQRGTELAIGQFRGPENCLGFMICESPMGTMQIDPTEGCSFWPCDGAGNKVRWPTDSNGAML